MPVMTNMSVISKMKPSTLLSSANGTLTSLSSVAMVIWRKFFIVRPKLQTGEVKVLFISFISQDFI